MARPKTQLHGVEDTLDMGEDLSADATLLAGDVATPDPDKDPEGYARYVQSLRQTRKPFGALSQKLALPQRSGYKRHWFNDIGGRIQEHMDAGWTPVLDPRTSQPVKRSVGSGRDNRALSAYAMEIPSVFWEEVQQGHFDVAKSKMDDIKKSPIRAQQGASTASDKDKFYSPKEDILSVRESSSSK